MGRTGMGAGVGGGCSRFWREGREVATIPMERVGGFAHVWHFKVGPF